MGSDCCKASKQDRKDECQTDGIINGQICSAQQVEKLVRDALAMVRSLVEPEPEPIFMQQLTRIADVDWLLVVRSLCKAIPLDDLIGPAVISLVLEDCPLPCKEALLGLNDLLISPPFNDATYDRNLCVSLSCIAEKLAGPSCVSLLSKTTLNFLFERLDYRKGYDTRVILFALIALEKFAQTSENRRAIEKYITDEMPCLDVHPLIPLEQWIDETDIVRRQVGFCAQWALDNIFVLPERECSYLKVDLTGINVMLNGNDVSECLKISPNGLEARGDATTFESVRSTFGVSQGCWYYEVQLLTGGIMQIGWATRDSQFVNHEGYGIGDDKYSIAYDGCRQQVWHGAQSVFIRLGPWKPSDIVGCLLDIDRQECIFSLNGVTQPASTSFPLFDATKGSGFFAAASFMTYQQCRFNFGSQDFAYPPVDHSFKSFNDFAELNLDEARIIPRHVKPRRGSISGTNVCTLCIDFEATIQLKPCGHSGFCIKCANVLKNCPLCRADIQKRDEMLPPATET